MIKKISCVLVGLAVCFCLNSAFADDQEETNYGVPENLSYGQPSDSKPSGFGLWLEFIQIFSDLASADSPARALQLQGGSELNFPNSALGVYTYFNVLRNWAEAYAGVKTQWQPLEFSQTKLNLGFGLGLEQNNMPVRFAGFFAIDHKYYLWLTILEQGGSGFWYKSTFDFHFAEWFNGGFIAQKDCGIGLRYELKTPDNRLHFWLAAPMLDYINNKANALVGLKINF